VRVKRHGTTLTFFLSLLTEEGEETEMKAALRTNRAQKFSDQGWK
jgi:hypothetical protein